MKKALCVLVLACAVCLGACAGQQEENNSAGGEYAATISVNKDGSVESRIVEEFVQEHYDVEELKIMIEASIDEYMQSAAGSEIKLKSCKKSDENVIVEMEYSDYKAYAGFNDEDFFVGTIKDAYSAGYTLDNTLTSADSENMTVISKQELLGMGESHILIWDALDVSQVKCFNDIMYTGEGVTLSGKKTAGIMPSDENMGVIVFE